MEEPGEQPNAKAQRRKGRKEADLWVETAAVQPAIAWLEEPGEQPNAKAQRRKGRKEADLLVPAGAVPPPIAIQKPFVPFAFFAPFASLR